MLGIVSIIESPQYGNTPLFEIFDDARHLVLYPAALFEVSDARCSSYWQAAISDNGSLILRPKELYQEFFHDDLSENDRAARQTLDAVITRLKDEFPESATRPHEAEVGFQNQNRTEAV